MKGLIMEYPLTPTHFFIEAVPKTSVGKFDKKVLRERFKNRKPARD